MASLDGVFIPKGLIDSKPDRSVLLHLAEHYLGRALPEKGVDSAEVFESPRCQLMVRTCVKGTTIGAHFHSVADELVVVVGGSGELFVNGEWRPVTTGDVHVCPRGNIHDTRALTEDLRFLSIFAPHLPPGTDINWVK
jgi:quercetin dioxygenase-like cupin family protein